MAGIPRNANSGVLTTAVKSVSYNVILQILLRIVSFISNALIIRFVSKDVLGVVNVRLMLLYSTTHCLSREAFRRSSLCKIDEQNRRKMMNLLWLPVPVSFFTGLLMRYLWLRVLRPPDENIVSGYEAGVNVMVASVLIETLSEPLYVLSQSFHFVKLKVIIEGLSLICKSLCTVILLTKWPQLEIYSFYFSQVLSSLLYTTAYFTYFYWYFNFTSQLDEGIPVKSVSEVFPKFSNEEFVDKEILWLTWSFYKQTILKQFLTEGERYLMTILNILSFSEQGVYDIVSNLGSLAARLIFLPIEETGYVLFSHLVKRGEKASQQENASLCLMVLQQLLKLMSLLGLAILIFGFSYSQLLLLWYGGESLSKSLAHSLLRWHCFYILFLAINGISECFVMASMNSKEIDRYNQKMIVFSIVFLIVAIYFTSVLGSVGFLFANCLNAGLRIAHSFYFTQHFFSKSLLEFTKNILPHSGVLFMFAASFVVTSMSETYFCCSNGWAFHFIAGACCFLSVIAVVIVADAALVQFVKQLFLKEHED